MEHPSLEQLMREPYPELSAALRARVGPILERFRALVREILPSADELTFSELIDHLPVTLEDMADAIAASSARRTGQFLVDSKEHGSCRYHQSYNLSELLVEYSILRTVIVEEVTGAMKRPLTVDELSGLIAGIDAAARRAVGTFVAHQQREIQSSAEAQSKYLAFLSHDLRGSLNGILLMLEVLKRELTGSTFQNSLEDLDLMRRSILDTVGTMDRFLHAEKFRRGKVDVKLGEVNLSVLLPEVVSQVSPQAKSKGVSMSIDSSRCPHIVSDRDLLLLIVQNLVSNAVKYSTGGNVRITAALTPAGGCRLSVEDEGPGITPEKLSSMFEPFTRGETHGQGGIGLGLSIARQAADLLKGRLWAESVVGKGSTFILELPVTGASGAASANA
jgi:signal transduction histidine kinase